MRPRRPRGCRWQRQSEGSPMGIGVSIFLIALGAVLLWAVTATVAGVSINVIGVILLVVGCVGLIAALIASQRSRREPPLA